MTVIEKAQANNRTTLRELVGPPTTTKSLGLQRNQISASEDDELGSIN